MSDTILPLDYILDGEHKCRVIADIDPEIITSVTIVEEVCGMLGEWYTLGERLYIGETWITSCLITILNAYLI